MFGCSGLIKFTLISTHFPLYLLLQCTSCSSSKHHSSKPATTDVSHLVHDCLSFVKVAVTLFCLNFYFILSFFVLFWRPNAIILLGCWKLLTAEISGHRCQMNYYLIVRLCHSVTFLVKLEVSISGSVPCRPNKCNKCRPIQMTLDTFQWLEL